MCWSSGRSCQGPLFKPYYSGPGRSCCFCAGFGSSGSGALSAPWYPGSGTQLPRAPRGLSSPNTHGRKFFQAATAQKQQLLPEHRRATPKPSRLSSGSEALGCGAALAPRLLIRPSGQSPHARLHSRGHCPLLQAAGHLPGSRAVHDYAR